MVIVICLLHSIFHTSAYATDKRQPQQELLDVATRFLERHYASEIKNKASGNLQLSVNPLDPRIKVKACDERVQAFWPYKPGDQRRITVGVRCDGVVRWKLYFQATMKNIKTVAVLNTHVSSGDILDAGMISMRDIDTLTLRNKSIQDASGVLGMKFKRSLRSGTVISTKHLLIPATIKRGDLVEIISGDGPVQVRAQGYAMDDGQVNELIKIKNSSSNRILQAYVIKTGYVQTVR